MNVQIEESWGKVLAPQFESAYFEILTRFVRQAYQSGRCFPPGNLIFEAFRRTPFNRVKVVIIGQDPYHGYGQAHGLCFSVQRGINPPPSLKNIYKELISEFGEPQPGMPRATMLPDGGDLSGWADQGVLMLNATLTVSEGHPGSHQGKGWETFTDSAIKALSDQREHIVFLLWGNYARQKRALIDSSRHLILECAHPSPFSASNGFFGCGHFVKANSYLQQCGIQPIVWL